MTPKIALAALLATPALAAAILPDESGIQIVGGEKARKGDYPFIVSLAKNGTHYCGGTLLNEKTILTAAHCGEPSDMSLFKARAGSLMVNDGGKLVEIASITTHPDHRKRDPGDYDVAIWKLKEPVKKGDGIAFAKLADAGKFPETGLMAGVAGWGADGSEISPTDLLKVTVPIVSPEECAKGYPDRNITDTNVCAAYPEGGKDACAGDSGGPLIDEKTRVQIGIVSWGYGCGWKGRPGVYTAVSSVRDFIDSHI